MFKNKSILFIICFVLILTVVVGSTVALIIVKTDDILNVFRPKDPTGDLLITKTVTHPYGDAYQIPDNISFTFQVELGADYANKTVKTSAGEMTADENGMVRVTVKPGLSVGIYEIPTDKQVTVTETDILPGFAPEGGAQRQVTIPKRTQVSVLYHNIYTPAPATSELTLTGIKTLEGRQWQEGDSFTFSLEAKQTDWTELGTRTVTYDPENADFNKFDFTEFLTAYSFDRAGTYSFRISEKEGTIGGIAYDPTVSYVDVTVTDADMDGSLEITGINASQNATVTGNDIYVTICNTYAPAGSAEATLHIQKIMDDQSGQNLLPEGYSFLLTDSQGNAVTTQATGAAGETVLKLVFEAIDAGKSFDYTLTEVKGEKPGMTYDETVYNIRADVIDNLDGTIRAEIYVVDTQQVHTDSCRVSFTNTYIPTAAQMTLTGMKYLEGRALKDNEFIFQMYETDASFQVAEDAVATLAGSGPLGGFGFAPITYTKVGNYYYVVKEDSSAQLGGILYDDTVYQVTVTVTDDNGVLVADRKINDKFGNAGNLVFQNTYSPLAAVVQILAEKTLEGAQLEANQFLFELYQADENFEYGDTPIQSANNDGEGKITFTQLRFDAVGSYYYVVVENSAQQAEGMTYDENVYGVQVDITDDGAGNLVATTTVRLRTQTPVDAGQTVEDVMESETTEATTEETTEPEMIVQWVEVEKISFVNTYEAPPTTEPSTDTEPTVPPTQPPTPPTGDDSTPGLFLALLIFSGIALAGIVTGFVLSMRKKKK